MKAKWLRRWWRDDRRELERQRADNVLLRAAVAERDRRIEMLTVLVRALRDVNADLDRRHNAEGQQ